MPLYGQVSVQSPATDDFPEFISGDEEVVFTPTALAIATRGDAEGDVCVTILEGVDAEEGELIFDADVDFAAGVLEYGNIPAADVHAVALLRSGITHLSVYATPPGIASHVAVVLPPGTIGP